MNLNRLDLEQLLDCPICFEQLDGTNRVLPCQHTFCKKCLETVKIRNKELRCPECRKEYKGYLSDLPCNITIIRILEQLKQTDKKAQTSDISIDTKNTASPLTKSNDVCNLDARPANSASSSARKTCNYGAPPANFASSLASSVAQLAIHDRKKSNVVRKGVRPGNSAPSLASRSAQLGFPNRSERTNNLEATTRKPLGRNDREVSVPSVRAPSESVGLVELIEELRRYVGSEGAFMENSSNPLDEFSPNQPSSSNSESSTQSNQEDRSSTFSPSAYSFSVELKSDKRSNLSKRLLKKNYLSTTTPVTVDSTILEASPIEPVQQAVTRPFDPNSYTFSVELKPTNRISNQRRPRKNLSLGRSSICRSVDHQQLVHNEE